MIIDKLKVLHIGYISGNKSSGQNNAINEIIILQESLYDVKVINIFNDDYNNNLHEHITWSDLVVFHSVYYLKYKKISKSVRDLSKPYIILPHGSLTNIAQKKSMIIKKVVNKFYLNKFLKYANGIQFLSEHELERSLYNDKGFIIHNHIDEKTEYINNGVNMDIVFIGRKDIYYKGLDILIRMISKYKNELNSIKFFLYGPEINNSNKIINEKIKKYNLESILFNREPIFDKEKYKIINNSYATILMSRSEGLPTIFLESLSVGKPIIASEGAGIESFIKKYNCGWIIKNDDDFLNLITKINLDEVNYKNKITNAKTCLNNEFSSSVVKKSTIEKYKKITEI